jgi:hypothetical protein
MADDESMDVYFAEQAADNLLNLAGSGSQPLANDDELFAPDVLPSAISMILARTNPSDEPAAVSSSQSKPLLIQSSDFLVTGANAAYADSKTFMELDLTLAITSGNVTSDWQPIHFADYRLSCQYCSAQLDLLPSGTWNEFLVYVINHHAQFHPMTARNATIKQFIREVESHPIANYMEGDLNCFIGFRDFAVTSLVQLHNSSNRFLNLGALSDALHDIDIPLQGRNVGTTFATLKLFDDFVASPSASYAQTKTGQWLSLAEIDIVLIKDNVEQRLDDKASYMCGQKTNHTKFLIPNQKPGLMNKLLYAIMHIFAIHPEEYKAGDPTVHSFLKELSEKRTILLLDRVAMGLKSEFRSSPPIKIHDKASGGNMDVQTLDIVQVSENSGWDQLPLTHDNLLQALFHRRVIFQDKLPTASTEIVGTKRKPKQMPSPGRRQLASGSESETSEQEVARYLKDISDEENERTTKRRKSAKKENAKKAVKAETDDKSLISEIDNLLQRLFFDNRHGLPDIENIRPQTRPTGGDVLRRAGDAFVLDSRTVFADFDRPYSGTAKAMFNRLGLSEGFFMPLLVDLTPDNQQTVRRLSNRINDFMQAPNIQLHRNYLQIVYLDNQFHVLRTKVRGNPVVFNPVECAYDAQTAAVISPLNPEVVMRSTPLLASKETPHMTFPSALTSRILFILRMVDLKEHDGQVHAFLLKLMQVDPNKKYTINVPLDSPPMPVFSIDIEKVAKYSSLFYFDETFLGQRHPKNVGGKSKDSSLLKDFYTYLQIIHALLFSSSPETTPVFVTFFKNARFVVQETFYLYFAILQYYMAGPDIRNSPKRGEYLSNPNFETHLTDVLTKCSAVINRIFEHGEDRRIVLSNALQPQALLDHVFVHAPMKVYKPNLPFLFGGEGPEKSARGTTLDGAEMLYRRAKSSLPKGEYELWKKKGMTETFIAPTETTSDEPPSVAANVQANSPFDQDALDLLALANQ